ncbi:MAG: hypothetical protein FWG28_06355 [Clostridiales bacterium]|nr:hypothetical protein [Clostridiales bacterium]
MGRQKEPQVSLDQVRSELRIAKESITSRAEGVTVKEYMRTHPYMTLGAAFLSGAVLSGSGELREKLAKAIVDIISNEVIQYKQEK